MKILAIGGLAGAGKSTIIFNLLKKYKAQNDVVNLYPSKYGGMWGHYIKDKNLFILGRYDGTSLHKGTDRLSMGIVQTLKEYMKTHKNDNIKIIYEGQARLFNTATKDFLDKNNINNKFVVLNTNADTIKKRLVARQKVLGKTNIQHNQSITTSVSNMINKYKDIEVVSKSKLDNIISRFISSSS